MSHRADDQDERARQRDHRCRHARPQGARDAGGCDRAQCRSGDQVRPDHGDPRSADAGHGALHRDPQFGRVAGGGLRQRHALRGAGAERRDRAEVVRVRDARGHPDRRRERRRLDHGRYGQAPDGLAGHSAGRGVLRHDRRSSSRSGRSMRRCCIRRRRSRWAIRTSTFWVEDDVNNYALDRFGPLLENHPLFPERCNISIAQVVATGPHHRPHLGARRGAHARLRQRGLRGAGQRGAHQAHRPQGDGDACRAAISSSSGARTTMCC